MVGQDKWATSEAIWAAEERSSTREVIGSALSQSAKLLESLMSHPELIEEAFRDELLESIIKAQNTVIEATMAFDNETARIANSRPAGDVASQN